VKIARAERSAFMTELRAAGVERGKTSLHLPCLFPWKNGARLQSRVAIRPEFLGHVQNFGVKICVRK